MSRTSLTPSVVAAAIALVVSGCFSFDRSLIPGDGSVGTDAGRLDAAARDAGNRTDAGTDACVPAGAEVCDGSIDEDCDGSVDEGCACTNDATRACVVAGGCSGEETCADGAWGACVLTASDDTCDGTDDDCDGEIDESADCAAVTGCTTFRRAGHAYLFCEIELGWEAARESCQNVGYDLATIEDAPEDVAIMMTAAGLASPSRWWMGLQDRDGDGVFDWASGSAASYRNTSFVGAAGECGVVDAGATDWGGDACSTAQRYVCEAEP